MTKIECIKKLEKIIGKRFYSHNDEENIFISDWSGYVVDVKEIEKLIKELKKEKK